MRISDWSSDVCSSDLAPLTAPLTMCVLERISDALEPSDAIQLTETIESGIFCAFDIDSLSHRLCHQPDRNSVVSGKRVSVRVDLGGRRILKKKQIVGEFFTCQSYYLISITYSS